MSIIDSDIVLYASQNMPQSDSSTTGGEINSGVRVVFTDIAGYGKISAFSNNSNDTGNLNITGRDAVGIIKTDTIKLSGTTAVVGTQIFDTILVCSTDYFASGEISIQESSSNSGVGKIFPHESGFLKPFYDATANIAGGANKELYEKIFIKNNNLVNMFSGVSVTEVNSGLYNVVNFGLEKSQKYNESTSNRTVAPTGITNYGAGPSGLSEPIVSNSYQGIWLKLTLNAGTERIKSSFYEISVNGQSL
tara:strand:+ start:1125 stop:1871 length:747 start_codon:yes stop_codon:yes gene_type:complete